MKKFISIFLVALVILGLGISVFANDEVDIRDIGKEKALDFVINYELYGNHNPDNLNAVIYPTYQDDEVGRRIWIGMVYDGNENVHSVIMKEKDGTIFAEGSASCDDLMVGINLLKDKLQVDDEDIKLFLTVEAFYASVGGNTSRMYRVGNRMFSSNDIPFVEDSFSINQLKKASDKYLDYINSEDFVNGDALGGGYPVITDFIKPEFPLWGYIAIAVGVVLVSLTVFSVIKRKKKSNG